MVLVSWLLYSSSVSDAAMGGCSVSLYSHLKILRCCPDIKSLGSYPALTTPFSPSDPPSPIPKPLCYHYVSHFLHHLILSITSHPSTLSPTLPLLLDFQRQAWGTANPPLFLEDTATSSWHPPLRMSHTPSCIHQLRHAASRWDQDCWSGTAISETGCHLHFLRTGILQVGNRLMEAFQLR